MALPCRYCGAPAGTVDHVVPRSLLKALGKLDDKAVWNELAGNRRIMLVPACQQCNSILGSMYFDTFRQRRRFVLDRLRQKNRKLLAIPDWTTDEMSLLASGLRRYILDSLARRDHIKDRVRW